MNINRSELPGTYFVKAESDKTCKKMRMKTQHNMTCTLVCKVSNIRQMKRTKPRWFLSKSNLILFTKWRHTFKQGEKSVVMETITHLKRKSMNLKKKCLCIRLNSSRLLGLWRPPKTTTMGRPNLSCPCINNLLWSSSFGISDGDMQPFGTNSFLQLKYLRNKAEAFSMSRSRALRNLRIIKSSTS